MRVNIKYLSFKTESALEVQLAFFTGNLVLLISELGICTSCHFQARHVFLRIVTNQKQC